MALLPEDKGRGKIVWIVLGAIVTAVVGVPIAYVGNIAKPKPTFKVEIPSMHKSGDHVLFVDVSNSSAYADAKDVRISIDFDSFPAQGILTTSALFCSTDLIAPQNNSTYAAVFKCPLINAGENRSFRFDSVPSAPRAVSVEIQYEGNNTKYYNWGKEDPIYLAGTNPPKQVGIDVTYNPNNPIPVPDALLDHPFYRAEKPFGEKSRTK
jgi:hypothetical protein